MLLHLDDQSHPLIPIKSFREAHMLPTDFGVATFEPKDYTGLGSVDTAGQELNQLRQLILDSVPATLTITDLMSFFDALSETFRTGLYNINTSVGLREAEVEFAVAGFTDVNQALMYALVRSQAANQPPPDFDAIYAEWLQSTVRLSQHPHAYAHEDETWQAQMINHAYGRIGLKITTPDAVHYVHDTTYACPAEGYMRQLLNSLALVVIENLERL